MPAEQGGVLQVWRGVFPHIAAKTLAKPATFFINEMLRYTPFFQPHGPEVSGGTLFGNISRGAVAGSLVSLMTYPLKMASLRLQLDVCGGTMGQRTFPSGTTASVIRSISRESGILSYPLSKTGGLYRGFAGELLYASGHRGLYFGLYDTARNFDVPFGLLGRFALGYCVTNLATWITYPISVGIVRAQAAVAPCASLNGVASPVSYKGAINAMIAVASAEGVGAIWRGYGLSLASSLGGAFLLVLFDYLKQATKSSL